MRGVDELDIVNLAVELLQLRVDRARRRERKAGEEVDLVDAVRDRRSEFRLGKPRAAVQNEGDLDELTDPIQPLGVDLRGPLEEAVHRADRDGQGVHARLLDKPLRILRLGVLGGVHVAGFQLPALGAAHVADFRFNAHAAAVSDPDELLGDGHVLLHRERRAVEHDRRASAVDGFDTAGEAVAVVQMQADGNRRPLAAVQQTVEVKAELPLVPDVGEEVRDHQDDREALLLRRGDNGLREVVVQRVERAYRVLFLHAFLQDFR